MGSRGWIQAARAAVGGVLLAFSVAALGQSDPTLGADAETVTDVTELYVAQFGRAPDLKGLQYWLDKLREGKIPNTKVLAERMFATPA
ncbi:DUF4214 domain-containing protein, partial [Arhodomonas sp. SL1]|uniref:DUF4214 domain-containing protein n=1 Tax=Arhodomonas sp. SL1 TaxID=3425691 RepID=UPI003F884921